MHNKNGSYILLKPPYTYTGVVGVSFDPYADHTEYTWNRFIHFPYTHHIVLVYGQEDRVAQKTPIS